MFCGKCKVRQAEIEYLRERVNDLTDRLMAFTKEAMNTYELKKAHEQEVAPVMVSPLGQIEAMEATTDEEKQQKEQAIKQMQQIMGH